MYAPAMELQEITVSMVIMPAMVLNYALSKAPSMTEISTMEEKTPGEIISASFGNKVMLYPYGLCILLGAWVMKLILL